MAFTAADVKNLRETTGVGMMDCKKALTEADGDFDKAIEILREKGLAASQKKAGRIAAEGMAYAASIDGVGVVVEVNAETDFVAKNEKFVDFVKGVAATIAANKPADLDALMECKYNGTDLTVTQQQQEMVLVIGENIKVRRFAIYTEGVSVPYIHAGGKIGVLVNMDTTASAEAVEECGKNVCMQVAALKPQFTNRNEVSAEHIAHEKEILLAQIMNDPKESQKPAKVIDGIVTGRINKELKEICLLDQVYVKAEDGKQSVGKYVESVAKEVGAPIAVKSFVRFETGEGMEKREDDFAAEVAKQAGM